MSRKDLLFAYVFEFNGDFLEFGSELGLGPLEVAASEAGLFKKVLQFLDSDTQLASEKKVKFHGQNIVSYTWLNWVYQLYIFFLLFL